jgi:hypothetical protein
LDSRFVPAEHAFERKLRVSMTTRRSEAGNNILSRDRQAVTGSNRRTLDAIFRHPLAHNLEWNDVVSLFETLGTVERKANGEVAFQVGAERHLMRRPHGKDLVASEVVELRQFLSRAAPPPEFTPEPVATGSAGAPNLMVVMDHREAKIYRTDPSSGGAWQDAIKPYDPHHFLHLTHRDQTKENGQRAPEDADFYRQITKALAAGGRIVVVGHGKGKSSAAHHLVEYLCAHHGETHRRIAGELVADLSSATTRQLLDMAREALR